MSVDTWARLVPCDENYIPSPEAQTQAVDYFWNQIEACDEVVAEVYDTLTFVDADINDFSFCPHCEEGLDFEFWMEWYEVAEAEHFKAAPRILPCCGQSAQFRDLDYDFDQGFGHFCLEAMVFEFPLDPKHIAEFERILGCPLRVIYRQI